MARRKKTARRSELKRLAVASEEAGKATAAIENAEKERKLTLAAQEARVAQMQALARRFASWAARNNVPFDYSEGPIFRKEGHWLFTSDGGNATDSLGVSASGEIDSRIYAKPTPSREKRKIDFYWPGQKVYLRVAELCEARPDLGHTALMAFAEEPDVVI